MPFKLIQVLRKPSKLSLGIVLVIGAVIGTSALAFFNYYVGYTNHLEFCLSCHEMKDTVYQEYKETIHYKNAAGVRAVCADCHVPHTPWIESTWRKLKASNELIHKVLGTIDTKEKFEEHRLELAQHVWTLMKERDSLECRNCHAYEFMDFEEQDRHSARKMKEGIEEGKTCIDCHKGIAHNLPEGYKKNTPFPPVAEAGE
jgi:nitrate/TMAO reductase-like tetraheme cytochrome c subunit